MAELTSDTSAELPSIPSQLLELALADLERAEISPYHTVNMRFWMQTADETCEVCLAGAVMAFSLNVALTDKKHDACPDEMDSRTENLLRALDAFRTGSLEEASILWRYADTDPELVRAVHNLGDRYIPHYDPDDPVAFKASMRDLIADLKAIGA